MTAALYLVPAGALAGLGPGDTVILDGDEGHHAATVKRARVGEQIMLGDGQGMLAHGIVAAVQTGRSPSQAKPGDDAGGGTGGGPGKSGAKGPKRSGTNLAVQVVSVAASAAPGPRYVLAQALAKGGRDELAVETATELGVDQILPWQAARSIVTWRADRGQRSREKWQASARAAAKQARRALVPQVAAALTTAELAQHAQRATLALVLHEEAVVSLPEVPLPDQGEVLLIVGPEGGIAPDEIQALTAAGAVSVRLGEHVLRASTAGPAALAVLCARTRWGRQ